MPRTKITDELIANTTPKEAMDVFNPNSHLKNAFDEEAQKILITNIFGNSETVLDYIDYTDIRSNFVMWLLATKESMTPEKAYDLSDEDVKKYASEFTDFVQKNPLMGPDAEKLPKEQRAANFKAYGEMMGKAYQKLVGMKYPSKEAFSTPEGIVKIHSSAFGMMSAMAYFMSYNIQYIPDKPSEFLTAFKQGQKESGYKKTPKSDIDMLAGIYIFTSAYLGGRGNTVDDEQRAIAKVAMEIIAGPGAGGKTIGGKGEDKVKADYRSALMDVSYKLNYENDKLRLNDPEDKKEFLVSKELNVICGSYQYTAENDIKNLEQLKEKDRQFYNDVINRFAKTFPNNKILQGLKIVTIRKWKKSVRI